MTHLARDTESQTPPVDRLIVEIANALGNDAIISADKRFMVQAVKVTVTEDELKRVAERAGVAAELETPLRLSKDLQRMVVRSLPRRERDEILLRAAYFALLGGRTPNHQELVTLRAARRSAYLSLGVNLLNVALAFIMLTFGVIWLTTPWFHGLITTDHMGAALAIIFGVVLLAWSLSQQPAARRNVTEVACLSRIAEGVASGKATTDLVLPNGRPRV